MVGIESALDVGPEGRNPDDTTARSHTGGCIGGVNLDPVAVQCHAHMLHVSKRITKRLSGREALDTCSRIRHPDRVPENRLGLRRGGWGSVAIRFMSGLVGGLVNAFAILGTLGGVIAYSFRHQEDATQYSGLVHFGNVAFNGFALYILLTALGDEKRSVLPTMVLWATSTASVCYFYWNWALG